MSDKPFTTIIKDSNVTNLPTGSKVRIQTIPFIKAYDELSRMDNIRSFQEKLSKVSDSFKKVFNEYTNNDIINSILDIDRIKLRHSDKYIFTSSAMRMHDAISKVSKPQWITLNNNTWIELETPITTPYGENVKAVYVNRAYPIGEIDKVIPVSKDKTLNRSLHTTISVHKNHWSLDIITIRGKMLFDFTYNIQTNEWIYVASHICQYGKCQYPIPSDLHSTHAGLCIPCEQCKQACAYWNNWIYYAIEMIQGKYSIDATKPNFPIESMEYTQIENVTVGKSKKNKRIIKKDVTRSIDYTIIKYDVSTKKHHELPEITEQEKKRVNWLMLTDKSAIIWEHVRIKSYDRRYPIKRDGSRKDGTVTIKEDFYKWTPYLAERKTVKKVVASQYEDKNNE